MRAFVLFVVGMWALLVGIIGYHVWRAQRIKREARGWVTQRWLSQEKYHRNGDLPPGTRR